MLTSSNAKDQMKDSIALGGLVDFVLVLSACEGS